MIGHITRATRHLLFWSLIATALVMTAARILLSGLDDYQRELENRIRQATDVPFKFGQLEAGMRGFNPEVILRDIRIEAEDPQHKPDMQLREIRVGLNFLDLLLSWDFMSASRITLVGANLHLTRKEDGSLAIKGLHASDEQPLWLLKGRQYEILDSQISWQDLKRHGREVHFDRFDLVLKNHFFDHSHEVHLVSSLPAQYGDAIRISARVKGNIFQADDIEGQLYIEGTDLQAATLITGDLPLGLDVQSGAGDLKVWSEWKHSKPYQIDGYIQAQQINIRRNQAKPVHMDTFQANFSWSDQDGRWRLAGYDIDIFTQRQRWPDGAFYLQQDAAGNLSGLIKQLDLPAAMLLAPLLVPAEPSQADWLKLNPSGRLHDVSLFVSQDLQHYAVRGAFDELGNEHYGAIPQLRHVSGQLSVTDQYGQIVFDTHDAQADVSDLFRNPLELKRLQGTLHWWQTADAWQFYSQQLEADSADFATVSSLNLLIPKGEAAPVLDMRTRFGAFLDISQAKNYLPAKIMNEGAVAWLDDAFIKGQVRRGEMVIQGALDQFPFTEGQGRFETVFTIENGELQFNQDWPHLQDLYADVQFAGPDLQVTIAQGRSEKVDIDQALVTIPDLADSEHVFVWGKVRAKVMDSLSFLQKSPLRTKIDPIANLLDSTSDTRVDLQLKIPYEETEPVRVNVNADLNGAQLTLKPVNLKVEGIKGVLNFTEDRVSSGPLDARALGYPLQGSLSSDAQATYLTLNGTTSMDRLEKQFSFLQNEAAHGQFAYQTRLTLPYAQDQAGLLNITSNLKGLAIESGNGLQKTADEERPLTLDFQLENSPQLPLQLRYGPQLSAFLLIDKTRETLFSGHVVLGQGQASRYGKEGLKLDIQLPSFNVSQALGAMSNPDSSRFPKIREVGLDTGDLIWQGQSLGSFDGHWHHQDQAWQGRLNSVMAKGGFTIPDQLSGDHRILLDMDYLNLSELDKIQLDATEEIVTELPLIDINSRQLLWRAVDLGHLNLQTERLSNGIHFKKILLRNGNSQIDVSADWIKLETGGTATQVKGNLKMENFGKFLSRLGYTDDLKETSADIGFRGGWGGGPHQFSMERLNGHLQLNLKDGRISSIEPGFGRLLGLIAMEQWVKRLSLDFSDVFRQGLAFNQIQGHYKIKNGLAFTDDLTLDAVAATFNLAGYINLVDKTIDQRVAVVPKSSGALPIAGTIVEGIASVITQAVTDDYKEGYFFGSQYQLSGSWGNVDVTPLPEQDGLLNKTWRGLTDFGWLDAITE